MTLEYRSSTFLPPAKTGLMVWGVLVLITATFFLISCFTTLMSGLFVDISWITIVTSLMTNMGLCVGLGWTGMGIVRYRRWARPVVLALTLWIAAAMVPALSMIFMLPSVSAGAGIAVLVLLISMGMMLLLGIVVPLWCFFYFRTQKVIDTLNHYDPTSNWTDRWTAPVFGLGLIAGLSGITLLLQSIGTMGNWHLMQSNTLLLPLILQLGIAALLVVAGVQCLKRPMLGWRLVTAAVILQAALSIATIFIAPDLPSLVRNQVMAASSARTSTAVTASSATTTTSSGTTSITIATTAPSAGTVISDSFANSFSVIQLIAPTLKLITDGIILLILRKHFYLPRSSATPPPLAVASLKEPDPR